MKNLTIYFFLFCLCMLGHVSGSGIRIMNELKNKKTIWMRCSSKEDVLGPTVIPSGGEFVNNFNRNIFGRTRFMCTIKQGPTFKRILNFRAFKEGGKWDWRVREDGIYLKRTVGRFTNSTEDLHKDLDWIV
ncbi:PREDICTED: pumilio homolog 15-like [Camelina sativa]|uniref:S-protein homolog n=1 Tax=Camelina sativa TaxID=90675 RepID=A0ABM0UTI1_CAMSA|nr:PREDICTED: pumilio homolog 15-like [Camelina sativa]